MTTASPGLGSCTLDQTGALAGGTCRESRWFGLPLVMLIYAVLSASAAVRNSEFIDPDGVSYIRHAEDLVAGRYRDAVSGYWAPLISWCIAPLLRLGVDGLHAARIVLAVWGGVLVLGTGLLSRRTFGLSGPWRFLALLLVAIWAVHWSVRDISPDLSLAACLSLYFSCVTSSRLLETRSLQLLCGLAGGVSYLAKAYAFPFFLVHFPLTLGLQYWRSNSAGASLATGGIKRSGMARRLTAAWTRGMIGFVVISGPWIGALYWKYGLFTYSTAAAYNRALVGPGRADVTHPFWFGLWTPPSGRVSVWEVPESLPFEGWSALSSRANLLHQARLLVKNGAALRRMFLSFDVLGVSLFGILAGPALISVFQDRREGLFLALWVLGTAALYCSGYALVLVDSRYVEPVLWPLACLWCFSLAHGLWRSTSGAGDSSGPGCLQAARVMGVLVLAVSFGMVPAARAAGHIAKGCPNPYRSIARQLLDAGLTGPMAATRLQAGLYIAYHMRQPYLMTPSSRTWPDCERELEKHGVQTLLVWSDSPLAKDDHLATVWAPLRAVSPGLSEADRILVYRRIQASPASRPLASASDVSPDRGGSEQSIMLDVSGRGAFAGEAVFR